MNNRKRHSKCTTRFRLDVLSNRYSSEDKANPITEMICGSSFNGLIETINTEHNMEHETALHEISIVCFYFGIVQSIVRSEWRYEKFDLSK